MTKVFLAGIMQGSLSELEIHAQNWREPIRRIVAGHLDDADIYCHYSEHPQSMSYDLPDIRRTLIDGIDRAGECDLLVAYVPGASMGTAIEMYEAKRGGAVVVAVSPLAANWVLRVYCDRILKNMEDFETFASSGELARLVREKHNR